MDLPYPSQKDVNDRNPLDAMKKIKSTIWSTKDLNKQEQSLSLKTKSIFLKLIEKDKCKDLAQRIKKHQIPFTAELGSKLSRWSFLHFCARWNAKTCMQYIIKTTYQKDQQSLYNLMNSKTCQGYTPLMVAVIYNSSVFLKSLLQFGGIDIFLIDNNRITAYQMAISAQNQYAIKKLMDYEVMNKTSTYVNTSKFQQPFSIIKAEKDCCCTTLWYSIRDWLFRSPKDKEIMDALSQPMCTSRRTSEACHEGQFRDHQFPPKLKSICTSVKQLDDYQIEWLRIQDLYDSDKGIRLFETYSPFEIIQTTFVLKHNLIVLQLLSRNPILLRRIICRDEDISNCYKVYMYPKGRFQRITIDDYIPCLKDKMQPMFITDSKECWPLLLQKAWVKTYGSYVAARNIHPRIILHEMTGFFTETYKLEDFKNNMFETLKKFCGNGFMTLLTSKKNNDIIEDDFGFESFTILNFHEKDNKRMYLVNCPLIISKWKDQQKSEPFGLKLLKAHYNTMNQMSIWMDTPTLLSHFQSFTVCHLMDGLQRTQFSIKGKQCIFFKFFMSTQDSSKQKYFFKLYQYKDKDQQYYQEVIVKSASVSRDDRIENEILKKYQHSNRIQMIEAFSGEYFLKVDVANTDMRSFNLIFFGKKKLTIEGIDSQMGKIQWLYLLRDKAIKEDMEIVDQYTMKRELSFFDCIIIIIKDLRQIRRCHKIGYQGDAIDYVIQGQQEPNKTIRLETYQDQFLFAMIKMKPNFKLPDLKLSYSSS